MKQMCLPTRISRWEALPVSQKRVKLYEEVNRRDARKSCFPLFDGCCRILSISLVDGNETRRGCIDEK